MYTERIYKLYKYCNVADHAVVSEAAVLVFLISFL